MSELIVVGFDNEFKADEVLLELTRRQDGYRVNQEDAAVVVRKADGQLFIRHSHPLTAAMSAHGGFWGLLIGALLLNPLAGVLVGGTVGAVAGSSGGADQKAEACVSPGDPDAEAKAAAIAARTGGAAVAEQQIDMADDAGADRSLAVAAARGHRGHRH